MPSLLGSKPNQVSTNGELGTLAFQDANAVNITGGVVDVSAGTAALPTLGTTGDDNTGVFFPAADTVAVSTNGVERVRIDSTGNVGVGVTPNPWLSSQKVLEVSGWSVNAASLTSSVATNAYVNSSSQWIYKATGFSTRYDNVSGQHQWFNAPSGTAGNAITFTQAMTLNANGKLLVGTAAVPVAATVQAVINGPSAGGLELVANNSGGVAIVPSSGGGVEFVTFSGAVGSESYAERMRIDNSGNLFLGTTSATIAGDRVFEAKSSGTTRIESISTGQYAVYNLGSGASGTATAGYLVTDSTANTMVLAASTNTPMLFSTNNAERMRIDSSGNVLLGVTSNFSAERICILFNGSTNNGIGLKDSADANGAYYQIFRNSSNTIVGSITRNGTSNAVLYNTSSDYRLKENIKPLENGLAKVLALNPVTYTWKENGESGEGFIAHELQAVIPRAVSGEKDAVFKDGSVKPQQMDASYAIATLVKAMQEQQTLIENLTTRLNALEGK